MRSSAARLLSVCLLLSVFAGRFSLILKHKKIEMLLNRFLFLKELKSCLSFPPNLFDKPSELHVKRVAEFVYSIVYT